MRVLDMPDARERFAEQGLEMAGSSPGELDEVVRTGLERWGNVIRASNITLE